jgi:hypothetical protein
MIIDGNKIIAENGKELKRKADGMRFGNEITLGYTHYIGGVRQSPPLWELPEHYEEVDSLDTLKANKIADIVAYDSSENVNAFIFDGQKVWLDKATRVGLMNSTSILKASGKTTTHLWLNGTPIGMSCDRLIELLSLLEVYALECYNVTEQHKANVMALYDESEIVNYDYTTGYPPMLKV